MRRKRKARQKKREKVWVRNIYRHREEFGELRNLYYELSNLYYELRNLYYELRNEDRELFFKYVSTERFDHLLSLVHEIFPHFLC